LAIDQAWRRQKIFGWTHGTIDVMPAQSPFHIGETWLGRCWLLSVGSVEALVVANVVGPGRGLEKGCQVGISAIGAQLPALVVRVLPQDAATASLVGASRRSQAIMALIRCPAAFQAKAGAARTNSRLISNSRRKNLADIVRLAVKADIVL
jgi:hypothetical protein